MKQTVFFLGLTRMALLHLFSGRNKFLIEKV
jgi:hypothetical protein